MLNARATWLPALRCGLVGILLLTSAHPFAEQATEVDLELYFWLPVVEFEAKDGSMSKITQDDLLGDLDIFAKWAGRLRRGRWSMAGDLIYARISDKNDLSVIQPGSDPGRVTQTALESWTVTPNIGYTLLNEPDRSVELYVGARYFWIEFDATIKFDPLLPGGPQLKRKTSPGLSSWDAIAGIRGLYHLSDHWYSAYSINAGAGDSDFTWGAQAGFAYKLEGFDALFGWRYLDYDIGDDTLLKSLTVNGPFAGVIFRW